MTTTEAPWGNETREGNESPGEAPNGAPHPRARPGAYGRAILILRSMGGFLAGGWLRLKNSSPYTYRPESIRDVVGHTRRGGWIPGEHPWWVESPGYVFGLLVAIPATAMGNMLLWVAQRMGRTLVTFGLFYGLLYWAGVAWLVQVPLRFLGRVLMFVGGGS